MDHEQQERKRPDRLASGVDGVIGLHFISPPQVVSASSE
jgi:3-hydroxyacyl-CoA dehydrogenase